MSASIFHSRRIGTGFITLPIDRARRERLKLRALELIAENAPPEGTQDRGQDEHTGEGPRKQPESRDPVNPIVSSFAAGIGTQQLTWGDWLRPVDSALQAGPQLEVALQASEPLPGLRERLASVLHQAQLAAVDAQKIEPLDVRDEGAGRSVQQIRQKAIQISIELEQIGGELEDARLPDAARAAREHAARFAVLRQIIDDSLRSNADPSVMMWHPDSDLP